MQSITNNADSVKSPQRIDGVSLPSETIKTRPVGQRAPQPVLIIDSREQAPLPFSRLQTRPGTLSAGDYSIAGLENRGLFAVERKSIEDLVGCVGANRERFEAQLLKLKAYRFKRLAIIGSEAEISRARYRSNISPKSVFSTLEAFEIRYDLPFLFFLTPELAARRIESWATWFSRELYRNARSLLETSEENAQLSKAGRLEERLDEKPEFSDIRTA
jgi:DNA excision repair protein ERCC-4